MTSAPTTTACHDWCQFVSTQYPAILEGDLNIHHLKRTDNISERRTFCRKSVRALWEKLDNESWGGENFDHEQILKHMPRDKHSWVIDERDRLRDESTIVCDHCDLHGHRGDTCPTKTPVCYMCGLTGHLEPSYPRKNCLICGLPNQLYSSMCRDCYGWGALACSECGQRGHPSSHCSDLWRRYHSTFLENTLNSYYYPEEDEPSDEEDTLGHKVKNAILKRKSVIDDFFEKPKKKKNVRKKSSSVGKSSNGCISYISSNRDDSAYASHLIKIEIYDIKKTSDIPPTDLWKHAEFRVKYYATDDSDENLKSVRVVVYDVTKQLATSYL